jgi:hypothetical protein
MNLGTSASSPFPCATNIGYFSVKFVTPNICQNITPFDFLFSLMKLRITKCIQCRPCFINGPKFPKISFFQSFYIIIRHLVFITFIQFMYISTDGVCGKNFEQKNLFRHFA